jgi:cystathionine beta-lyase/cystathionine gamma-synthase
LAFSSGVAATDAVIKLLQPGDEVICANDMYGGTYRLFTKVFEKFGIRFIYVDTTKTENISKAVTDNTKLIWIETPTNPLMNITDIAAVAKIAKPKNILVVDNTFASPALQNPLDCGADIVMHSATKYLGGHSDVIQGALMMNDKELRKIILYSKKLWRCTRTHGLFFGTAWYQNTRCKNESTLREWSQNCKLAQSKSKSGESLLAGI